MMLREISARNTPFSGQSKAFFLGKWVFKKSADAMRQVGKN
jgi:hypothetical protein